jgi:8-oxo-dGTP pyrophosphatase MutT (NUDIX family)
MEFWDLYDEKRQSLGLLHKRGGDLPLGTFHLVVSIWTVNTKREVLLTLRSPEKDLFPDFWENTAGSVVAGENSKQGAVRELFEETGIVVSQEELFFLGTQEKRNAFVDMFMIQKDIQRSDIRLQAGETVDAKWVTLAELDEMIGRGELAFPVERRLSQIRNQFEAFLFKR